MTVAVAGCSSHGSSAPPGSAPTGPAVFLAGAVPLPSAPGSVVVDPGTHKVYVATPDDNAIQIVDPDTKTVVGAISSATHPVWLQIDPARHRLYSVNCAETNCDGGSIELIDLNTAQVTATVPVGDRPMLAVDADSNVAYSISKKDFGLSVIDPEQGTVTSTAAVPHDDPSALSAMAVDPSTHTVYIADQGTRTVLSVDPGTGATTPVAQVGDLPAVVSVDPATHLLYTLNYGAGQGAVSVVDPAAHRTVATIAVGSDPSAIAIDDAAHIGYVINGDGSLSAIDLAARALLTNVQTGRPTVGVTVDQQAHRVYVTNAAAQTLSVLEPSRH